MNDRPTPETDAREWGGGIGTAGRKVVDSDFSRSLECRLGEAMDEIIRLQDVVSEVDFEIINAVIERIASMKEALK